MSSTLELPTDEIEGIDAGVREYVRLLRAQSVETYESCEGGAGHAFSETTIAFHGSVSEGFRALSVAMLHQLPVRELRRVWRMEDGEPVGPSWHLVFFRQCEPR